MKTRPNITAGLAIVALLAVAADCPAQSTNRTGRGFGPQGPRVISPEISPERKLTFRILAPKAEAVRLAAGDIQGLGQNTAMVKGTNGVWEITVGPINSGAYRYNFNVDGVTVIDPRNPATSESNENTWSLVNVPDSANTVPQRACSPRSWRRRNSPDCINPSGDGKV